jgi:hypothetical protein
MSFGGKWMELKIMMLSEISHIQKAKYCLFSFVEPRPKMMVVVVVMEVVVVVVINNRSEGDGREGGKESLLKVKRIKISQRYVYIYIYIYIYTHTHTYIHAYIHIYT